MKYIAFACWLLLLFQTARAQDAPGLSLEEAFQRARVNRQELQAQNLQISIAESANEKVRAQWLPTLDASADLRWNTLLQSNVLPIGAFGIPGVPPDATRAVRFGTPFNNALSVQATQKIVDANSRIDRQINDNETERQRNEARRRESDARFEVAAAYYNARWQQERLRFATQAESRAQILLDEANVRLQNGAILQNDRDRLLLDLQNAQRAQKKAAADLALARKNLNYQMRAPEDAQWTLSETLEQLQAALPTPQINNRPEILAENLAATDLELRSRKQLARLRPSVDAYGNVSLLQLHDQPNPFAADTWFPFHYVGIRATVPIYDGRLTRLEAREFARRAEINRLNAQKLQADFSYQTEQFKIAVQQAELDMAQAKESLELAKQIYETDALRFEQGVTLITTLRDSAFARQQAENDYLAAAYSWLVAALNYRRASGM
jgi:outer membrane protein TolC